MNVNFYNFEKLHTPELYKQVLERFEEIIKANSFVEGKYNTLFEQEFAKNQNAKHCLLLANGTDALEIALQAYDIGVGDKVGIPGISFFATAECVINRGATPVFIDVDPNSGLMDPESLERILEVHELKAIIPVHIYGMPAPIAQLEKICRNNNIKIIEDGAQGQGGFYENKKPIGSSKHITTFSFYPTKNLGAFGDAGAVTFENDQLKDKILSIRNHGRTPNGHGLSGRNSRCDHLQAAVLQLKLTHFDLEGDNKNRKMIAKKYFESLSHLPIKLVDKKFLDISSWHLFPIRTEDKETKLKLQAFLDKSKIQTRLFYEKSLPQEKPLMHFEGEVNHANHFADTTFTLPMHPFLTDDQITYVGEEIKKFFN